LRRGRGGHFLQARFPAIRGVAVNDSTLGRFIDCRNQGAKFFRSRFARNAHSPLERPQPRSHTPVVKRTRHRLPGTLGCGLCISHWLKEKGFARAGGSRRAAKLSRMSPNRRGGQLPSMGTSLSA